MLNGPDVATFSGLLVVGNPLGECGAGSEGILRPMNGRRIVLPDGVAVWKDSIDGINTLGADHPGIECT